jgi:catechol 2,3-dioxygenase-like lactoylglutathione lyase family enzyme
MNKGNLKINKLQHIGIPTVDLERSKKFYESLGFEAATSSSFEYQNETGQMIMMRHNETLIEIYQFPDVALEEIRKRKVGSIDHIAFDVSDIDTAYKHLKNVGHFIFEDAPVYLPFWKNGCKYFNIAGPDGERIEFNQIL